MAQFRAVIQGSRGQASRLGTKRSNMYVTVQSWAGQINIVMWHKEAHNEDYVRITLTPHAQAHDGDACVCLYEGPCDGWRAKLAMTAQRVYNRVVTAGVS